MFPPRCSVFIEIAHLLSQQQHHLLEVALEKLFAMPQHYLVFCCERKFQSGSVLHQLFSTIQVLCFWSTWFCKIELWHRSLKVLLAKAGNNVCIQWIESNKQFINQLWTKKALCFCRRESLLQPESLCIWLSVHIEKTNHGKAMYSIGLEKWLPTNQQYESTWCAGISASQSNFQAWSLHSSMHNTAQHSAGTPVFLD